jgi:UbiD family decarboxylase
MPFALSLGQDPVIPFFAGMPLRDGVSEGPVIGGYLGNPIDVVACETVDLEVPASSEIVIEGHLTLDEMDEEGPMAEYPGYLVLGSRRLRPVYRVSAMTYRNHAILPIVAAGYPPEENHTCWDIGIAATVLAELRRARWPVTSVFVPFEAACHLLVVTVSSNWRDNSEYRSTQDFTRALGAFVFSTRGGTVVPRVLVVLDDIDPSKPHEVLWAMATRVHPGDGEIPFPTIAANPLNAFMKAGEKAAMLTNKAVIDGLPRDDWGPDQVPVRADFATLYPAALKRSITELWSTDYGFPPAPVH